MKSLLLALSLSAQVGIPGGIGVEVAYRTDAWAVGGHARSSLLFTDLGIAMRHYFAPRWYAGLGAHVLDSPLIFRWAPSVSVVGGFEHRYANDFTLGVEAGGIVAYTPPGSEGGGNELAPIPVIYLRVGKVF